MVHSQEAKPWKDYPMPPNSAQASLLWSTTTKCLLPKTMADSIKTCKPCANLTAHAHTIGSKHGDSNTTVPPYSTFTPRKDMVMHLLFKTKKHGIGASPSTLKMVVVHAETPTEQFLTQHPPKITKHSSVIGCYKRCNTTQLSLL